MKAFIRIFNTVSPAIYLLTVVLLFFFGVPIDAIIWVIVSGALVCLFSIIGGYIENRSITNSLYELDYDEQVSVSNLPRPKNSAEAGYQRMISKLFLKQQMILSKAERRATENSEYYAEWRGRIQEPLDTIRHELNERGVPSSDVIWEQLRSLELYAETALCYIEIQNGIIKPVLSNQSVDITLGRVMHRQAEYTEMHGINIDYKPLNIFVKTDERLLGIALEEIMTAALDRLDGGSARITAQVADTVTLKLSFRERIGERKLRTLFESGLRPVASVNRADGNELNLCREIFKAMEYKVAVSSTDGTTDISINMGYPSAKVNLWKPELERKRS